MSFENLAYVPLDLPLYNFDYNELKTLMDIYGQPHHPYPHIWHALAFCGMIVDFDDPNSCDDAWNNRYDDSIEVRTNHHINSDLTDKFLTILHNLPYKKYTFAQILSQKMDVPPHQDGLYDYNAPVRTAVYNGANGFNQEPEPAGLKVMLSHRNARSFYLSEKVGSKRNFIKMPETTNCFAVNERKYFHGAKHPGESKYILSTFGIIDEEKHKNLINRSLEKYKDYAIWF